MEEETTTMTTKELSLEVVVKAFGLVGGDFEYRPYLAYWGTWGRHRVARKTELDVITINEEKDIVYKNDTTIGSFHLPEASEIRGDESIWIKLFSRSKHSGIEALDKRDGGTERNIQSGICSIKLSYIREVLLGIQKESNYLLRNNDDNITFTVKSVFYDPKLLEFYINKFKFEYNEILPADEEEIISRAAKASTKANMDITMTLKGKSVLSYFTTDFGNNISMTKHSLSKKQQLLYGTKYTKDFVTVTMNQLVEKYVHLFIRTNENPKPEHPGLNDKVDRLHLVILKSEQGFLPIFSYWSHDYFDREYINESDRKRDEKIYEYTIESERFFEILVISALRRYGLSVEVFMKEVNRQFIQKGKHSKVSTLYLTCLKAVADIGTFAANTGNYTSDFRYDGGTKSKILHESIPCESMDSVLLNGTSNSDDCEGQENTGATIIRAMGRGRLIKREYTWESGLLRSVKRIIDNRIIIDIGATVTSAYVDQDGQKVSSKDIKNLPMIGDRIDINSRSDGHCHSLWVPLAIGETWLKNGGLHTKDYGMRGKYERWEYEQKILILEGTGSVDPFVLPPSEVYSGDVVEIRKEKAIRTFVKSIVKNKDKFKVFTTLFSPDGLSFYFGKVEENRRVSTFYREVIRTASIDLKNRYNIVLSGASLCDVETGLAGINVSQILRDFTRPGQTSSNISLILPYDARTREWKENVRPSVAVIQNQMPYMSFGRYTKKEFSILGSVKLNDKDLIEIGSHDDDDDDESNISSNRTSMERKLDFSVVQSMETKNIDILSQYKKEKIKLENDNEIWKDFLSVHFHDGDRIIRSIEENTEGTIQWHLVYRLREMNRIASTKFTTLNHHDPYTNYFTYPSNISKKNCGLNVSIVEYHVNSNDIKMKKLKNHISKDEKSSPIRWSDLPEYGKVVDYSMPHNRKTRKYNVKKYDLINTVDGKMKIMMDIERNESVVETEKDRIYLLNIQMFNRNFYAFPLIFAITDHSGKGTVMKTSVNSWTSLIPISVDKTRVIVNFGSNDDTASDYNRLSQYFFTEERVASSHSIIEKYQLNKGRIQEGKLYRSVEKTIQLIGLPTTVNVKEKQEFSFHDLIGGVAVNENLAVVRFFSRTWKFKKSKVKNEQFFKELTKLYNINSSNIKLLSHGFFKENHLPQCEDILELTMIIDITDFE
jgi:hypothetical protein